MNRILDAIHFATKAHLGQLRKDKKEPYIIHPLGVAVLLGQVGADEDTIIAGILHDTIEDCNVTKEEIENAFGVNVARMVNDVTEQDKSLPWAERKQAAMKHIAHMQHDSLLIKAADITYNVSDFIRQFHILGKDKFESMILSAPLADVLTHQEKRAAMLKQAWPENPLLPELEATIQEFKQQLYNQK